VVPHALDGEGASANFHSSCANCENGISAGAAAQITVSTRDKAGNDLVTGTT
jgi:hypothetical protein